MKKVVFGFVMVIAMVWLSDIYASATPNVAIQTWYLLDSGKHLDWDGSTAYQNEFNAGVNTWNAYRSGVIRQDTWYYDCDVTISDYYESNTDVCAITFSSGIIQFNSFQMNTKTSQERQNICTHELGHALGLAHNQVGDVMYPYCSSVTTLSDNDKASYDVSYFR